MIGTIRTKEVCPKCGGKFEEQPLTCSTCLTHPRRYFIDLWWKKRLKLYTGRDGVPLDSWLRAERLLTAIRHEIDLGTFDPKNYVSTEAKALKFDNYVAAWLERREKELERGHLSRSYIKEIKAYVRRHYQSFFGKMSIREIREAHIEDFKNQLPEHLSPKTVSNILGVLHKLLQDAYRRRDILAMPTFPKVPMDEPLTRFLWPEEQEQVLVQVKEPVYRVFYLFLMKQGCRPGEARALRWEDVNLKTDMVVIGAAFDRGVYRPRTKEREKRYLPLHPEVKKALQQLPRQLAGFVFINRFGRPLSSRRVEEVWRRAAQSAGINATCYEGTRHSFATQALGRGVHQRKIGAFMGHRRQESTARYAKVAAEFLKEVLDCPQTVPGAEDDKVNMLKNKKK